MAHILQDLRAKNISILQTAFSIFASVASVLLATAAFKEWNTVALLGPISTKLADSIILAVTVTFPCNTKIICKIFTYYCNKRDEMKSNPQNTITFRDESLGFNAKVQNPYTHLPSYVDM